MTANAAGQFQLALFDVLSGSEVLNGKLVGIFDEAPMGTKLPYLYMGETRLSDMSVKGMSGTQISFDLIIWSEDNSQLEVKELMATTDSVLAAAAFKLPGYDLMALELEYAVAVRRFREDGSYYEGRLRYRATAFERAIV
jgi:hypothetical protein